MNAASEPAEIVRNLWDRFQARDWSGAAQLVDQDVIVEWPVSRERMTGRDNFIGVNREYPEGWEIRVLRVVGSGDQAASEVEVLHDTLGVFRAASFWTVKGGLINRGTEYWTEPGADEPMPGRSQYAERY